MPWKELVKICKEEGAWSVIDGAHSIGQEVDVNLKEADPDFWVSVSKVKVLCSPHFLFAFSEKELPQMALC